jgi:hypothetical protein
VPFQLFVPTFSLHSITTFATGQAAQIWPLDPSIFLGVVSGSAETSASSVESLTVEALSNHLSKLDRHWIMTLLLEPTYGLCVSHCR